MTSNKDSSDRTNPSGTADAYQIRERCNMSESSSSNGERVKTREQETESESDTTSESVNETETCPECSGTVEHDPQRGDHACVDCGLVVKEQEIDRGPEWRAFNSQEKQSKSRVGSPTDNMMHDKGLATDIDWRNKDAYGRSLSSKKRKQMQRLRRHNKWAKTEDAKDRTLQHALGEISRMASALGIKRDIREIASMIFRQCQNKDMLPGRSVEGMSSAALYAACRQGGHPRSLDEIETVGRVEKLEIGRSYRYIDQELGLEIGPSDPSEYIARFISKLEEKHDYDLHDDVEYYSRELVKYVKENGLESGKTPPGIAAGAIYMAGILANDPVSQSDLADVSGVTEVTIRERYEDLIEEGDEEWLHTGPLRY